MNAAGDTVRRSPALFQIGLSGDCIEAVPK